VLPLVGSMISLPGLSTTALLGVTDHGQANAVFDRVGRVAAFDLGQHGGFGASGQAVQLDEGASADGQGVCQQRIAGMGLSPFDDDKNFFRMEVVSGRRGRTEPSERLDQLRCGHSMCRPIQEVLPE